MVLSLNPSHSKWELCGDIETELREIYKNIPSPFDCAFLSVRRLLLATWFEIIDALDEDGMLRYHGLSYGTQLGATFASMFPDRVD